MEKNKRKSGFSAKILTIPIVATIFALHAIIIILVMQIGASTTRLSTVMGNAGRYSQEATSLIAGTSLLSETAVNFVLRPDGKAGEGTLKAHANELKQHSERRGSQLVKTFENYDVPEAAKEALRIAADCAEKMTEAQTHAIALVRVSHAVSDDPSLQAIPTYELTAEELNMTDEERKTAAEDLLLGQEYSENRRDVSDYVNRCVGIIQQSSSEIAEGISIRVNNQRISIWVCTIVTIVVMIGSVFLIALQVIHPLANMARTIPTGKNLKEKSGLSEIRTVAWAYNDVCKRRNTLEDILRFTAETDALTGIPNRYCYEQHLLELEGQDCSVAIFLFDINFLKKTNDTKGHTAGDQLIRSAAESIAECFGKDSFRLGGDEFSAVVKNCTPESVEKTINEFEQKMKERDISISYGWSYTDNLSSTNLHTLFETADKNMYARKKELHNEQ